ncbi:MAG: hypothetical protein BGO01_13025 [Armatimonadetes bacterium 55-13]|nr:diguanylate cyclase [Armatimonadota bacterium]OJU61832.1 MAG: hypothetical protein BGO01_13025 [Armatimonadetes bacterium 55-13]
MGKNSRTEVVVDRLVADSAKLRFKDRERAFELAQVALEKSIAVGYRQGEGRAWRQLGALHYSEDRMRALECAFKAQEIAEEIGDDFCAAGAFMIQFCFYHDGGNYDKAFVFVKQAYDRAKAAGDRGIMGQALYNMGVHAFNRSDFRMAAEYQKMCLEAVKGVRNFHFRWWSIGVYGHALFELGQKVEAVRLLKKGLQGSKRGKSREATVNICSSLATIYNRQGQHWMAIEFARQGIACAESFEYSYYVDELYGELARAQHCLHEPEEAVRTYQIALEFSRLNGNVECEAKILLGLADAYASLNDFENAYQVQREYTQSIDKRLRQQSEARIKELETTHRVELAQAEAKTARQQRNELKRINRKLKALLTQKERLQSELERLASTDDLTGTLNRRQLVREGVEEMRRFGSKGMPLAVLVLDIDHFKSVNDAFGHIVGDQVLQMVTDCCKRNLREEDFIGRIGGEEFVIVLPGSNTEEALAIATRLRVAVEKLDTQHVMSDRKITVSIGLCAARREHGSFFELMNAADKALYEAKRNGRNQVCVSEDEVAA